MIFWPKSWLKMSRVVPKDCVNFWTLKSNDGILACLHWRFDTYLRHLSQGEKSWRQHHAQGSPIYNCLIHKKIGTTRDPGWAYLLVAQNLWDTLELDCITITTCNCSLVYCSTIAVVKGCMVWVVTCIDSDIILGI